MHQSASDNTTHRVRWPGHGITLLSAPHRLFFLIGAVQLVITMGLWLAVLCGWYTSMMPAVHLTIGSGVAHGFWMLFGVFTFFVFGFISTVFPRWLDTPPIARARYVSIAAVSVVGIIGVYAGCFINRWLIVAGCVLFAAGWFGLIATLVGIWRRSTNDNKTFALAPLGCITLGAAGVGLFAIGVATGNDRLVGIALSAGLWLYLVPLVVAISTRMIPFFSSRVLDPYDSYRPAWGLPVMLACVIGHFGLAVAHQTGWTVVFDLPLALVALWHTVQWNLVRSLRVPLLGILHVSFAWLSVAMLLYAVNSLLVWFGSPVDFGGAALHALAIGLVTSTTVAMATRVSRGHSGRTLIADAVAVWAFAAIQLTAIARVLAGLLPPSMFQHVLMPGAALLWLTAFVPWSLRYGAIYLQPRVDGQAG